MYIIKFTFEKKNSDVLKEVQELIPPDLTELTLQSNIIHVNYFRSPDRSYAEMFHVWENELVYQEWKQKALPLIEEFENLSKNSDIDYQKFYPESENEDWSMKSKLNWDHLIFYEDIFN
jgi:hypothetical protein